MRDLVGRLRRMPHDATLGGELERRRLEHRAHRIELALGALRHRMVYRRETSGGVPEPLRQAIRGFDTELEHIRTRLQRLAT